MVLKTFKKFLKETDRSAVQPQPGPTVKDDKPDLDDVNSNKINAIRDLVDAYNEGGFRDEDDFLQQIKIDVGIDFDSYDEVKEFVYSNKLSSEKDDKPQINKAFY